MLKKLTEEKQMEILEAGISEFADKGMKGASMSDIADKAGISVGVLYKYYSDKEDFFMACVRRSIHALEQTLEEVIRTEDKLLGYAGKVIQALLTHAREHEDDIRLYHEITSGSSRKYAARMAKEIEGMTARLYVHFIVRAQEEGSVRADADPRMFAFFFDNLLMMLQFSCCCDYYRERFKLYCNDGEIPDDEHIRNELLKFMESAFTLERKDITHRRGR
ncbi:MAG TPA: TetR/AcrR family transcriptional regulator [Candidatus Onthocola gallistercoris]|uniref:TetR/AcrR family transcriptional regulator n=1 Tax=Candidatus Onthocola gallistercoris TaxID=2840876 RepID=A0A9D1HHU1_9FIRM|nr:TetR/AcrR family transcriptional regulator [Candidatus Onthocola gallistercoris]